MKQKNCYWLILLTLIGIMTYSCQKDEETSYQTEEQTSINTQNTGDKIKLGKRLENPYSVENMRKALNNLKQSNVSAKTTTDGLEITTTHLYIKFIPKNEDELSILKRDSTFVLYDYPLDYEIEENGDFYRDPEVPKDQPTYQYCAVNVDKELPKGVKNEILEELFIPDEDKDDDAKSRKAISSQIIDNLVDEALRITNNLPKSSSQNQKSLFARRSEWRPAGTIKVWDDNFGRYVGVEGVEVRARRWFTTHKGIANSRGYYYCDGRFRRDANYSIDWERYDFALQDGWLNGATYNGPKKTGNWDLNLNSGKQEYYATIFRAAYHYYYKNIKGLKRPPTNSFWKSQMKIRAFLQNISEEGNLGTHNSGWRAFGLQSPIKIYSYTRPSIDIYGTVIHELAHASHWNMNRNSFRDIPDSEARIKESWARGVQWELVRMIYSNYGGGATIRPKYTQVVVDMIDFPLDINNGSENPTQDNVQGYTIKQIEDALNGQKSWVNWKNNIKNKYDNDTENNLDALFNHWD